MSLTEDKVEVDQEAGKVTVSGECSIVIDGVNAPALARDEEEKKDEKESETRKQRIHLTLLCKKAQSVEDVCAAMAKSLREHSKKDEIGYEIAGPFRLRPDIEIDTAANDGSGESDDKGKDKDKGKQRKNKKGKGKGKGNRIHKRLLDMLSPPDRLQDAEDLLNEVIGENIEPGIRIAMEIEN